MDEVEKLRAELAAEKEKLAAFRKENAELRGTKEKGEAEAYYGKVRDGGKLPPALFEKAVALDTGLSEGQRKGFREIWSGMAAQVDLSGKHAASKPMAPSVGMESKRLTAKIRAYQMEKRLSTFEEAAKAVYAENPALFEGGAA
jgi:hypothetical protein